MDIASYRALLGRNRNPVYLVLFMVGVFAVATAAVLYSGRVTVIKEVESYLTDQLAIREELFEEALREHRSNVRFLYATPPIKGIVGAIENDNIDPVSGDTLEQWTDRLSTIFSAFVTNRQDVAQIRFIGAANDGMELVRVERKPEGTVVAGRDQLQPKASRDYFKRIARLHPNSIYVSGISLNREYGEIEHPAWPTLRVAMPVFSSTGSFFGTVIINVNATPLLESLKQNLNPDIEFYLLNDRGEFIIHPDAALEFQFEYGDDTNWYTAFGDSPSLNPAQLATAVDQQSGEERKYLSQRTLLNGNPSDGHITAIVAAPQSFINNLLYERLYGSLVALLAAFLVLVLLVVYYQRTLRNKQKALDTRALYQAIVNGSNDAIVVLDEVGTITRWNDPATAMLGYFPSQIAGRPLSDIFPDQSEDQLSITTVKRVAHGVRLPPFVTRATCEDGKTLDVSVTLSPLANTESETTGITAIIRDISEQVSLEEEIRRSNANLENAVRERTEQLEVARNDALQSSRAKSEFLAVMSHEIRTPMNGVIGMMNLLRTGSLSQQQEQYLTMAESSVNALTVLINDILDMSKIEAGKLTLDDVEFELSTLLHTSVSSMAIQAQSKGVEVVLDLAGLNQDAVRGDPNRVRQIVSNLVGNAIKFTKKGEIVVTGKSEPVAPGRARFSCSVRDTGIGISNEAKQKLFEAFTQEASYISREFGGTGLGLSICKQLCLAMDGDIHLQSTKGEGSTFSFDIMLESIASDTSVLDSTTLGTQRVAVKLFNTSAARALERQLEKLGAEAVPLDSAHPPDLVIVDQEAFDSLDHARRNFLFDGAGNTLRLLLAKPYQTGRTPLEASLGSRVTLVDRPLSAVNLLPAIGLRKDNAGDQSASANPATIAPDGKASLQDVTILVVDDHVINREVAAGMLRKEGATVQFAENGQDAITQLLAVAQGGAPDLILMDCQMPVMNGFDAARKIREGKAGEAIRQVPIIALTAGALDGERQRCLAAGMNDFLSKPIDETVFRTVIRDTLPGGHTLNGSSAEPAGTIVHTPTPDTTAGDPAWNRAEALRRVGDNAELLDRLTGIYLRTVPDILNALKEAGNGQDIETLKYQAHQLKGISDNLCAERMSQICRAIEGDLKSSSLSGIPGRVDELFETFLSVKFEMLER